VVEWGALGSLFVIGALSFHDARPRGASEIDYREDDEFQVGDFLVGLQFRTTNYASTPIVFAAEG